MPRQIFITGASGFIGKRLVDRLAATADCRIKILTRKAPATGSPEGPIERVIGDLLNPNTYRAALEGCDLVVHLAAATGRTTVSEYQRVNVEGTGALLQACKEANVGRLVHVSTIAAGYLNQRYYPYAQTKMKAEALVRESGLEFVILRPTLVLGQQSPIWRTLLKIASMAVIPMPQGRTTHIQPIHVDDVVRGIERLLTCERFEGETLELGGPRPIQFRAFLQVVQQAVRGAPGKIINVPLAPIRIALAAIEPVLRPLMPVTAGQLAIFANDSVASENWLISELRSSMSSTEETVAALVRVEGTPRIEKECQTFSTYLVGQAPSAYITERYAIAAQRHGLARDSEFSCFDRATLKMARGGRLLARWADAYCALFHPKGVLRRKLVLLAAILEHVAPTSDIFDRTESSNATRTGLALVGYGAASALSLLLGALVLLPAKIFCEIRRRKASPIATRGKAL
jgi:nucleoside-diphosphate-sugar epimerase